MSSIAETAKKHEVTLVFSGKRHFYDVKSGNSGRVHKVSVIVNCDCEFYGREGLANSKPCSHIIAALNKMSGKDKGLGDPNGTIQRDEVK